MGKLRGGGQTSRPLKPKNLQSPKIEDKLITVVAKPEPASFDHRVRVPGNSSLLSLGINANLPLPKGMELNPYWRRCMDDLYESYEGVCAYLSVHIPRAIGAVSTDHFIAKSSLPSQAYEWDNYRLACLSMNTKKNSFDDVLDPFAIPADLFRIELVTGRIYTSSHQSKRLQTKANLTIARLGLDDGNCRRMRCSYLDIYRNISIGAPAAAKDFLKLWSPFLWTEVVRQKL